MYIVIKTKLLLELQGNHTGIEKHPETLVPFYILNFHKPNPFYPYKLLITLSFKNTSSLRIDNPLHIVLQAPFIIERHHDALRL